MGPGRTIAVSLALVAACMPFTAPAGVLRAAAAGPAGGESRVGGAFAQDADWQPPATAPNAIEDRAGALRTICERLREIQQTRQGRAVVLHVGDSHVQAGFFGDAVRARLGAVFGDAGHGLIVPKYRKRVVRRRRVRYVLTPLDQPKATSSLEFRIALRDNDASVGFDTLVFIHDKGPQYLDFEIQDEAGQRLGLVASSTEVASFATTTVRLPATRREATVRTMKTSKTQKLVQVYAVSLESDRSGVLYHSYGVIGASTEDFVRSDLLRRYVELLKPDLVIVSLGTNDAFAPHFDPRVYAANMRSIATTIRGAGACASCSVLVTTPTDALSRKRRRVPRSANPNVPVEREVILQLAGQDGWATWDLLSVMGGSGSIVSWRRRGLAGADFIHFTPGGYELQGRLFCSALLDTYQRYVDAGSQETR